MAGGTHEYCDLVMKGGVISGIVYPAAVVELSAEYRFKNIGGTSAGAMAAAATAAAALGERRKTLGADLFAATDAAGFKGLGLVASDLTGEGFIDSLFQPARGGRRPFALVLRILGAERWRDRIAALVAAIPGLAPVTTTLTLLLLLLLGWSLAGLRGIAAVLLPALVCALLAGLIAAAARMVRLIRGNLLGLCAGLSTEENPTLSDRLDSTLRSLSGTGRSSDWRGRPALTEWLHATLQSLSGQSGRPLLFEDLWEAPKYPGEPGASAITLEMITTSVSHNEPRSLPFQGSTFWFRLDQFERLFPADVVQWLADQDQSPIRIRGMDYYRLPNGGKLPVVVAARLSLSFPLLISAVPLYEREHRDAGGALAGEGEDGSAPSRRRTLLDATDGLATGGSAAEGDEGKLRVCWFSDGGIGSNFPLHMFDAPMPRWPTFAINLVYPRSDDSHRRKVFLPNRNNQGWQRRYEPISSASAGKELAAFLFAIVKTMQNWRDLLQSRAPGHRDRIVHVPLFEGEGGFSFGTPERKLRAVADRGREAGRMLIDDFDFDNHWWVRWRNCASAIERFTIDFARATQADPSPSYAKAYRFAWFGQGQAPSYRLYAAQLGEATARLDQMTRQGESWTPQPASSRGRNSAEPLMTRGAPRPRPILRIVPTF